MKRTLTSPALPLTVLAAGLALLAPGAGRAAAPTAYTMQPIVKLGDKVADVTIRAGGDFEIGALNDNGQLAFVTENGGSGGGEMLLQYANSQFIPIVVAGRDAPGGKWAAGGPVISPSVSMNERGNVAFATYATIGGTEDLGTLRWDYQNQMVALVAFKGIPAVNNLTFVNGSGLDPNGNSSAPLINNSDAIVFSANVKNAVGATRSGVFFQGQDGRSQAVALPDQALPGGVTVQSAYPTGLTDAGVVAFVTGPPGKNPVGTYVWENGTITPLAVVGTQIPGLGKVALVGGARVNNKDGSMLLSMQLESTSAPVSRYRWANGQFTLLFIEGQDMPGSGKLKAAFGPFALNDAGQFAFPATLTDGSTAAYLLDTDGSLSLILKSGTPTGLGTITAVGPGANSSGIGLNSKGQVALPVKIGTGPATLVLLTPTGP